MQWIDILVLAVIVGIVGACIWYIYRAKKKGVKCIGCPDGESCCSGKCAGCGCGCGTQQK